MGYLKREKIERSITESSQWDFQAVLRLYLRFEIMNKK